MKSEMNKKKESRYVSSVNLTGTCWEDVNAVRALIGKTEAVPSMVAVIERAVAELRQSLESPTIEYAKPVEFEFDGRKFRYGDSGVEGLNEGQWLPLGPISAFSAGLIAAYAEAVGKSLEEKS